jgi:hypothetical protein
VLSLQTTVRQSVTEHRKRDFLCYWKW